MSDDNKEDEFNPQFIKCLALASGDKIITYIKDITQLGSYVCERPFSTYIDPEEGSYVLMQFQPYSDGLSVHIFQAHGVIGISEVSDYGRTQYMSAVQQEIIHEKSNSQKTETIEDIFDEVEKYIDSKSSSNDKNVVDINNWKPKDDTTKH